MILLPSLNRVNLLQRFFQSYAETGATVPGHVLVDDEDYKVNEGPYDHLQLPDGWRLTKTGKAVTMGDKCRFIWPQIKDCKWVGLLNDDHYCITPEWDKKVEALLDGYNMVSTNDGNWNFGHNVVGLTAWSMPLLEAANIPIFPHGMQHWYIDNLWKAIGESTGCWLETMTVNIEHRHVYIQKMEQDDTFRSIQNQEQILKSQRAFQYFMEQDFKDVCLRIVELRKVVSVKSKFV